MQQRGITLVKLMAALAVVAAMLALVIPSLTVASRTYKLKALAKEIEGQLQNGRVTAINQDSRQASFSRRTMPGTAWTPTEMELPTAVSLPTGRRREATP